ncbi:hypothetical protein Poli38472_009720 [Pythium oligandrum]|uniref:U2 snRNP-associated SURP motif-containing protein n=1 Tax=Pythium oligandrum TaxID=41045 RepID=A0A8K1CF84_PYTOL|nr:hypothetical protein Poli38472_009720 [Pythium oligandrum]|eukprot:TMW62227.1 hypothetical protein Poli38472_009720 [Pythium oligandrum]
MERTEPTALPWGMEKTDMQQGSLASLTDEKLARFAIGQQKKSKFEKEREEREAKKRKADAEAAAMYATFVASFENEDDRQGKAFVRSGQSGESEVYRLKGTDDGRATASMRPQAPGKSKRMSEMDRMLEEMKQQDAQRNTGSSMPPPTKKRREIDAFLDEMKDPSQNSSMRDVPMNVKGSLDDGNPDTTNLYVGNLAPTVTEELLEREFGRYGRVYSVKIMWPRTDEERQRQRNSGFVSFYNRKDADNARVHLHDKELHGRAIVVGWGKAVKIEMTPTPTAGTSTPTPSIPPTGKRVVIVKIPEHDKERQLIDRLAAYVAKDGLAFENEVRTREARNPAYAFLFDTTQASINAVYYRWRVYSLAMGDSEKQWRDTPFQMTADGAMWIPPKREDEKLLTGQQVARARDVERGRGSSRLAREEHDRFIALLDELTLERESIKQTMGFALDNSEAAVDLVHIIRKQFHREDASAVALVGYLYVTSDILHNSSAAVKNASLFRTTFQECLPEIMDHLRNAYRSIGGRMSASAMRDKVLSVLTAWESWSLFPPQYLVGLNATFMRKIEENEYMEQHAVAIEESLASVRDMEEDRMKKKCIQAGIRSSGGVKEMVARLHWLKTFTAPSTSTAATVAAPKKPVVAAVLKKDVVETKKAEEPSDDVDGEPMDEDGLDGEPKMEEEVKKPHSQDDDEDLDGEPLDEPATYEDDVDGEPLDEEEDVDGVPLDDEDDVDGEPLDEDIDGELM